MKQKPLVLTPGDPIGIGPEITWKALQAAHLRQKKIPLLCVGARKPFDDLGAPIVEVSGNSPWVFPDRTEPFVWLLPAPEFPPSQDLHLQGYQSGWAIEKATQLVLQGKASALVTGPISKDRLQKGGYRYPGHTEFLAELCQAPEVTMMLANTSLRVSLVTTHLGLSQVSQALSAEKIRKTALQTAEGLRRLWGIKNPRLAVAALNPHAGESGRFGREEIDQIGPAIEALQNEAQGRFEITGPYPADTLFAKHHLASAEQRWDAIICMYHDQGLIPVKLLDFGKTVNITLGLPIIRTSVDHGVGFDIAGQGVADPSSLQTAIEWAFDFSKNQRC
ncbi:MAG: 4-hydroxythreonine-4-phosphate dehydrogenase PdxA [Bdellovibrionia bacterium]